MIIALDNTENLGIVHPCVCVVQRSIFIHRRRQLTRDNPNTGHNMTYNEENHHEEEQTLHSKSNLEDFVQVLEQFGFLFDNLEDSEQFRHFDKLVHTTNSRNSDNISVVIVAFENELKGNDSNCVDGKPALEVSDGDLFVVFDDLKLSVVVRREEDDDDIDQEEQINAVTNNLPFDWVLFFAESNSPRSEKTGDEQDHGDEDVPVCFGLIFRVKNTFLFVGSVSHSFDFGLVFGL
jgi:hypothetical protein|tara:strand:- start:1362 stop:2066 length:705 start_codon:yes stop_codon:yes gene_type:complete